MPRFLKLRPFVIRCRSRTVAKLDSIGFDSGSRRAERLGVGGEDPIHSGPVPIRGRRGSDVYWQAWTGSLHIPGETPSGWSGYRMMTLT